MSYEFELIALAVLLLLYDSTTLLCADEVILTCGRGGWRVSTGWRGFVIGGRRVCFLNPLTLFRPAARLRWSLSQREWSQGEGSEGETNWSEQLQKLTDAAPWTLTVALGLFVLLPLGLFTPLGVFAVLPAVTLIYGGIAMALWWFRRSRALPALGAWKFAGFAFECLACPPFGINLARRAGLMIQVEESAPVAALRLLAPGELQALGAHCVAVLNEELARLDDTAPRREIIEAQRARFESWLGNPHESG